MRIAAANGVDINAPKVGDEVYGRLIGKFPSRRFQWVVCPDCGLQRWVQSPDVRITNGRCHQCSNNLPIPEDVNNPKIGDVTKGISIGRYPKSYYRWAICPDCGLQRWVTNRAFITDSHCRSCRKGSLTTNWKGGRHISQGYVFVSLPPEDFFYPMVKTSQKHYVQEHRLVMARYLGRCLQSWELVHHKNGIKTDNWIGNLELTTKGSHLIEHNKGYKDGFNRGYADGKDKRIKELLEEIARLKKCV